MHRRISALLGASLLSVSLVACSPSPSPNATLAEMLSDAQQDAQALSKSAPELAEVRASHAEELLDEIHRVCGFEDDGSTPESCQVAPSDLEAPPAKDADSYIVKSQKQILEHLADVPEDSRALVIGHYIDESRLGNDIKITAPTDLSLSDDEWITLQDLAERENAAAWALGVAMGYLPSNKHETVSAMIEHHQQRAALLNSLNGENAASLAEPGYTSELPAPTDTKSALNTVSTVENSAVSSWHAAAAAAKTDQWRVLCAQIAGASAKDLALFDAS